MKRFPFAAAALFALTTLLPAQTPVTSQTPATGMAQPGAPQAGTPFTQANPPLSKRKAPKPAMQQAPGGGPDQVWVNTNSSVYHCPGDRFYGKTAHGRYMTEAAAKSAGAKGVGGRTCSASK